MNRKIIDNLHYLKVLASANPVVRKVILGTAKRDLIHCLSECAYNTLYNKNINLSRKRCLALRKHKCTLQKLSIKKISAQKKKKLLIHKGNGFLPILLPPLLSFLATVLQK